MQPNTVKYFPKIIFHFRKLFSRNYFTAKQTHPVSSCQVRTAPYDSSSLNLGPLEYFICCMQFSAQQQNFHAENVMHHNSYIVWTVDCFLVIFRQLQVIILIIVLIQNVTWKSCIKLERHFTKSTTYCFCILVLKVCLFTRGFISLF